MSVDPPPMPACTSPADWRWDMNEDLIVADSGNNCVWMVALPDRRVTTVAGSLEGLEGGKGYADCRGTVARFNWPTGVAIRALIPCMRGLLPFSSSSESVHPTKSAVTSSGNREYSTKHARVGAWFRGYCASRCIPRGREGPVFVLHFAQCIGELPAKLTPLTSSMLVPPTFTSQ